MAVDIRADDDDQTVDAWIPVRGELADPRGFARITAVFQEYVDRFFADRFAISSSSAAADACRHELTLMRGLTRGFTLKLWLEDRTLRLATETMNRLDLAWGLIALAVGCVVGLLLGLGFNLAMVPRELHARHWWLVALVGGGAAAVLIGLVTWYPKQLFSRRGRRESYDLSREIVTEVADVLGAELGPR